MIPAFSPFTPSRLTLARERRGLRKNELADRLEIERRTITGYEAGEFPPSVEKIELIAKELGFPVSFFSRPGIENITADNASFRSLSSMTATQRNMVFAGGAIAMEVSRTIAQKVQLPEPNIPDLRWDDPVAAAAALREHWKLGAKPIKNVVHLLEFHGIRVFSLADESASIDAFSLWRDGVPFVFVNRSKSGERGRFDAIHELAHLTLHRHGIPQGRQAERDADQFASAFLMPRESVLAHAPRVPRIQQLMELKSLWKVSAAALARRLRDLSLMSDWQYQSVCIDLSRNGYRSNPEPNGVDQEVSQLLPKALAVLREDGLSAAALAGMLGLMPGDLTAMTFGYVLVPMGGGKSPRTYGKSKAALRLV